MKNNCKNRKLKKIRLKNKFRLGETFYITGKISESIINEAELIESLIKNDIQNFESRIKLKVNKASLEFGRNEDDFIKDIVSYKIKVNRF